MSAGQMIEDVRLATRDRVPVSFYGRTGGMVPLPEEVLAEIKSWRDRSGRQARIEEEPMMTEGEDLVFSRPESLSNVVTHYCPGCIHGITHRLIADAMDELGIRERTVGIAPVGCSVLAYNYFECDFAEAAHGRAPAMATGMKRVSPDLVVFTYQGMATWPLSAPTKSSMPRRVEKTSPPSLSTMPSTA